MTEHIPDFSSWTDRQLNDQREHLASLLTISAGQKDPWKPRMRAEFKAILAEIDRRATADQPSAPEAGED